MKGKNRKILIIKFFGLILYYAIWFEVLFRTSVYLKDPKVYALYSNLNISNIGGDIKNKSEIKYNNGFLTKPQQGLKAQFDRDLVIGIFGGSVANYLSQYILKQVTVNSDFRNELFANFGKNRSIKIINLAFGGAYEPFQWHNALLWYDTLDIGIFLDGFNDMTQWQHLPCAAVSKASFIQIKNNYDLRPLPLFLLTSRSNMYHFLNPILSLFFIVKQTLHMQAVERNTEFLNYYRQLFSTTEFSYQDSFHDLAKDYLNCKVLEGALFTEPKKAYFFSQPIQYFPGSKKFSYHESKVAFETFDPQSNIGFTENRVTNNYVKLLQQFSEIVKNYSLNFKINSLTYIFKSINEDVYIDSCCHLNDLGNQILAKHIFNFVGTDYIGSQKLVNDKLKKW